MTEPSGLKLNVGILVAAICVGIISVSMGVTLNVGDLVAIDGASIGDSVVA